MRTLLLLRHAKSSWKDATLSDHDRPLNKRGKRDAPGIGRLLAREGLVPDAIVSSTAVRALSTARAVAEACGFRGEIEPDGAIYDGGPAELLERIRGLSAECRVPLLVGHNPDLEDLLEILTGRSETLPTAALARVELRVEHWSELRPPIDGRLLGLWRP